MQFNAVLLAGTLIDIDGTSIVQLVIFFIALVILRALIFKPMVRLFEAREDAIEGARAEAKELTKDAGKKADAFEEEMRKVRLETGHERDKLRAEGQKLERTLLEKVRLETQKTQEDAQAQILREGARMRQEIKASVPALSAQIAEKLLGRGVN